ncbi:Uncharacterized protein ChrSV_1889 [Chromobacterium vaccinii]|nr:Uncharacterized protein ChrSW_1889 [Chromobacterium vaccinii]QND89347.1 Uncharacterized protein ChrSV_1889 [Chromobacterium vaccinii]
MGEGSGKGWISFLSLWLITLKLIFHLHFQYMLASPAPFMKTLVRGCRFAPRPAK